MLASIRQELAKVRTEVAEKNAVSRFLRAQGHRGSPEVTSGRTPDRRVARMYLWRETPLGNICLVAGPSLEPELHQLHPHQSGPKGAVYFPAKGEHPALSAGPRPNPDPGEGGTAITRNGPSAPVRWLEDRGLIRSPVLDFGSGHGEDAAWLRTKGHQVREYDPNFEGVSTLPAGKYNTVLAIYVLNVLPKAKEKGLLGKIRGCLRQGGSAFLAVRSDVKRAGKTSKGYQRPVSLDLDIAGSPSGARIYALDKGPKKNPGSRKPKVIPQVPAMRGMSPLGMSPPEESPTVPRPFASEEEIPLNLAIRAFSGTSHVPESRAAYIRSEFAETMNQLHDEWMGRAETPEQRAVVQERLADTKQRYHSAFLKWLEKRSGVMSAAIVGPARFPVQRQRSKSQIAEGYGKDAQAVLDKGKQLLGRALRAQVVKEAGGPLAMEQKRLAAAEQTQAVMREANKIVRRKRGSIDDKIPELLQLGLSEEAARGLFEPDFGGRTGFPSYALTNNNALIKRIKEKIAKLEAAETQQEAEEEHGVTTYEDPEGQIVLYHSVEDGTVAKGETRAVKDTLKKWGFRWYRKGGFWFLPRSRGKPQSSIDLEKLGTELGLGVEEPEPGLSKEVAPESPRQQVLFNPHRTATAEKRIKKAIRKIPREKGQHPAEGLCYPASEAFFHAVGGKQAGFIPMQLEHEGVSHWWVEGPGGEVYDLTEGQFRTAVPHERSRGRGFLTAKPSERAQDLLALAQLRTNPQAKVGRVRKDKEGKKYVLWRPVLPDGSRPRIYLSAEEPMDAELIEVTEAAAELQHAKKVVEKREKEAKKKGLRGIWKGGSKRKIVYSKPKAKPMLRSGAKTPLFDSEGKEYRVTYAAVPTQLDGMGPVLASSLPETFEETPGYPTVFQARSLQRMGEASKIRKIARGLDPDKLLLPNADATLGAPVVWEGDDKTHRSGDTSVKTEKGVYYVLGGNGRVLAILMAPTDRYQSYVQRARSLWPDVWPPGGSPEGDRNVLVRVVTKPDGSPLTFAQARTLAGRTQKSAAGEESPIGRALSLIRSLGIERVSDLPPFKWDGIIIQDNVEDFTAANPAFTAAVLDSLGGARARTYAEDTALSSELFNNLMVGYLPRRFQLQGFVGEKQERALLTALPIIVSLHQGVLQGTVDKKWDLLPLLDSASRFAQMVKPLSDKKTVALVEAAAAQVQLGEGTEMAEKFKSLFDELPLLAVMFGVVLKKGERARDPAITVEKYLVPYAVQASVPEESPKYMELSMGQKAPGENPALVLAGLLGMQIPGAVRPTSVSQMALVANPRPRYEIGDTVFFHQWSDSKGWQKTEGTVVAEREHPRPKMSLRSGTPMQYRVRSHATNRKRWINDRDMRPAPLAQQRLLNRKGQLRLRVAASRILERLYLRGTTGYAANREGRFPPGVDELLEKGLAERVRCLPGTQTLYGTDTCTVALTARGYSFAKNRRRAERTHAEARQGRMWNPKRKRKARDAPAPFQPRLFEAPPSVVAARSYADSLEAPPGRIVILNMGLGRDSMTMLCLLSDGELVAEGRKLGPEDVDAVVFSDTGIEWKHTYALIPRVRDFAEKHGIRFIHLRKPAAGTEQGKVMAQWLEAMKEERAEREVGWEEEYKRSVQPVLNEKSRVMDGIRATKKAELQAARNEYKAAGMSAEEYDPELKKIRERYNDDLKETDKAFDRKTTKIKEDFGAAGEAERAWWAPMGTERREKFDTIEKRAKLGVYHLRPDLLTDFGWKGTIPLRKDKSCTGNHKVGPIRSLTEDLAIEKFGPWATNGAWSYQVGKAGMENVGTEKKPIFAWESWVTPKHLENVLEGRALGRLPHLNLIGIAAEEAETRIGKGGDVGCFVARFVDEAYPLVEMGIGKGDEQPYLEACGFPEVKKSGCWACPFQPTGWWWSLSVLFPADFERAVQAEIESSRRDPILLFTGVKGKPGTTLEGEPSEKKRGLRLPEAVAQWREGHPDADPHEVLDKQYAKCAAKFGKKNPKTAQPCCPECGRFVELWMQFGIPGLLDRVNLEPGNSSRPFRRNRKGGLFASVKLPRRPGRRGSASDVARLAHSLGGTRRRRNPDPQVGMAFRGGMPLFQLEGPPIPGDPFARVTGKTPASEIGALALPFVEAAIGKAPRELQWEAGALYAIPLTRMVLYAGGFSNRMADWIAGRTLPVQYRHDVRRPQYLTSDVGKPDLMARYMEEQTGLPGWKATAAKQGNWPSAKWDASLTAPQEFRDTPGISHGVYHAYGVKSRIGSMLEIAEQSELWRDLATWRLAQTGWAPQSALGELPEGLLEGGRRRAAAAEAKHQAKWDAHLKEDEEWRGEHRRRIEVFLRNATELVAALEGKKLRNITDLRAALPKGWNAESNDRYYVVAPDGLGRFRSYSGGTAPKRIQQLVSQARWWSERTVEEIEKEWITGRGQNVPGGLGMPPRPQEPRRFNSSKMEGHLQWVIGHDWVGAEGAPPDFAADLVAGAKRDLARLRSSPKARERTDRARDAAEASRFGRRYRAGFGRENSRRGNARPNRKPLQLELLGQIPVLYFASGSNHPGEIHGFAELGKAVGASYAGAKLRKDGTWYWSRLCSDRCLEALVEVAKKGTPVFLDSGAFSEVAINTPWTTKEATAGKGKKGALRRPELPHGEAFVVAPITDEGWRERLETYLELAKSIGPLANLVAPDKVGFQAESFERLERYAPELKKIIKAGATLLVPLHGGGALTLADAHRKAGEILGTSKWVPAIPYMKKATTPEELEAYLSEIRPERIHLLGIGPRSKKVGPVASAIHRGSPGTQLQMDSVALLGHTGRGKKPRRITAAQDVAREELVAERWSGHRVRGLEDWTDIVAFPSEWANRPTLLRIAERMKLSEEQTAELLAGPDDFFQKQINGAPFYVLAQRAIEDELARYFHKRETAETKRRGIVYGVGELYGGPQYIQNRLKKEGHWIDLFGPTGAPIPGEKGYKPPPELTKAWGGISPFTLADRMLGNALVYVDTPEMLWAYCAEEKALGAGETWECLDQDSTREGLDFTLPELVGVPGIGPDDEPLTRDQRGAIALSVVRAAMETQEERWSGGEITIGVSKSRKGPTRPILAPRGESEGSGPVPFWAARAMVTDWIASVTPGYRQDLRIVNIDKELASAFIEAHHSALPYLNARGMLYALGLYQGDRLVAVATANTPTGNLSREARVVAGGLDPHNVVELTRVASDGSVKGAASKLVSRLITILERSKRGDPDAPGMLVTFQLAEEKGTSYKALQDRGLRPVALLKGSKPSGARAGGEYAGDPALAKRDKIRWECCAEPPALRADWALVREEQQSLFNPLGALWRPRARARGDSRKGHRPPSEIQSLLFSKSHFAEREAQEWAKSHGFPSTKVHETATLHRMRVRPPGGFYPGELRIIQLTDGLRAVVGPPKAKNVRRK